MRTAAVMSARIRRGNFGGAVQTCTWQLLTFQREKATAIGSRNVR
jgi:hypothetical protein